MSEASVTTAPASREAARLWAGLGPVHLILFFSGLAGLGYQIVWTRMFAIGLGHELFAVLAVVAAFFAGLALGALLLDGPVARSRRPGLWYAGLEALIGAWTLGLIWLIPYVNGVAAEWIGLDPSEPRRWAGAFLAPLLTLGPATVAMGATLPAAERLYARRRRDGRGIGGLYAANAAGAMAGALATAAVIAPLLGFSATLAIFAAINFLCAAATLLGPARGEAGRRRLAAPPVLLRRAKPALLTVLFLTGLIGIGYEVALVRALSQLSENTVYSFAAILAVYLLGTALGAGAYQRFYAARRAPGFDAPAAALLSALTAATCALGVLAVYAAGDVSAAVRAGLGLESNAGGILGELAAAGLALLPASAAMGALFAHLAQAARGRRGGLGAAFAANTAGAALAPLAVGALMIPALGAMTSLALLSVSYLGFALLFAVFAMGRPQARWGSAGLGAAAVGASALAIAGPFDPRLITPPEGGRVLAHLEGAATTASVVEDAGGARWLRVNGSFVMGGDATFALDRLQGHAPLLAHPAPERALFLGVGAGATFAAVAAHPNLRAEGVELSREVLELLPAFRGVTQDLARAATRASLHAADARRYVRATAQTYDVIVADNFHPAKDGAGLLYTVEHFEAVKARLAPGGLFTQWLPLHQLDLPTFKLIARTFLSVFPDARLHLGGASLVTPLLGLQGGGAPRDEAALGAEPAVPPSLTALAKRPMPAPLARELAAAGLETPFALFGGFLAGPEALADYAGDGPLNTDDHPRALFEAPRTVYAPLAPASERVLALLEAFESAQDGDPFAAASHAVRLADQPALWDFGRRLVDYWRARDAFLRLGAETQPSGDPVADAAALAPKLIEIIRLSPDFAPAYRPALRMAGALARENRPLAIQLLEDLEAAAPGRGEASAALKRLRLGR